MRLSATLLSFLLSLAILISSCAGPGRYTRKNSVDPGPFLASLSSRETGQEIISSTLEVRMRGDRGRFSGETYLLLAPPSRFRLEIPGSMGSTLFVLVVDGLNAWVYYPEENTAYKASHGSRALDPILPFPLPADPAWVPNLIMGKLPPGWQNMKVSAYSSRGGQILVVDLLEGSYLEYILSSTEPARVIRATASTLGQEFTVYFNGDKTNDPVRFDYRFSGGRLTAEFLQVRRSADIHADAFRSPVPAGVPVTDMETPR